MEESIHFIGFLKHLQQGALMGIVGFFIAKLTKQNHQLNHPTQKTHRLNVTPIINSSSTGKITLTDFEEEMKRWRRRLGALQVPLLSSSAVKFTTASAIPVISA
jgi:hypothetical protein